MQRSVSYAPHSLLQLGRHASGRHSFHAFQVQTQNATHPETNLFVEEEVLHVLLLGLTPLHMYTEGHYAIYFAEYLTSYQLLSYFHELLEPWTAS